MRVLLLSVLALCACATARLVTNAEPIVMAERAFAADVALRGRVQGFLATVAPDAFTSNPDPASADALVSVYPSIAAAVAGDTHDTSLQWRPRYAGISRSGDFGFTTGPVFERGADGSRGNYFTVWRRQPDGAWKWIYDGGVGVIDTSSPTDLETVRYAPMARREAGSAEAAIAQINAIELQLSAAAANDAAAALLAYFADDAVVKRRRLPAANSHDEFVALARDPAPRVAFVQLRAEASSAGDLVFTVGAATWTEDSGQQNGFYARIWQLRDDGWRIVYDQINRRPPPPPS